MSYSVVFSVGIILVNLITQFIMRRFKIAASNLVEITAFINHVLSFELFVMGFDKFERVRDFQPSQIAELAILSFCHYNPLRLFFSFIAVFIYSILRTLTVIVIERPGLRFTTYSI